MSTVLVTGGTGALGRQLVPRLVSAGHEVRVLSRKDRPDVPAGVSAVRGDLTTGDGLAEAARGVDVIAHCASGGNDGRGIPSYRKTKITDVDGTRRLIEAATEWAPHLVYISIVGVDKIPLGYYRAKLEAEEEIERSAIPFSILRTTQWHTLALTFCERLAKIRAVVVPKGVRMQLLDPGEVADRMVTLASGPPVGRAQDMGGPTVLSMKEIIASYARASGKRIAVGTMPDIGKTMRSFKDGYNLTPGHADGRITWDRWLATNVSI